MAKHTELTVTVYNVKRATSSNLGNPRFTFNTSEGRFRTAPNAGCVYAVSSDFKTDHAGLDMVVTLILDGYGNIVDWNTNAKSAK